MKLCDTSVLVDIDRGGVDEKVQKLDDEGRHAISVVTVTELRLGVELSYDPGSQAYRTALSDLDRLLSRFDIIGASRAVGAAAASIMGSLEPNGRSVNDLHDVYIGATARMEELPVLTSNVRDLQDLPGVEVVDWSTFSRP